MPNSENPSPANFTPAGTDYRRMFDEAPLMYLLTLARPDGPIIVDCNDTFLQRLGYDKDEVLGHSLLNFYGPESQQALKEDGYLRAMNGEFEPTERQLLTRDGEIIPTRLHASPETDPDGVVIGTRAMFVDISNRKQAAARLQRQNEALLAFSRAAAAINSSFDLETVLKKISAELTQLLNFEGCAVSEWHPISGTLKILIDYGPPGWLDDLPEVSSLQAEDYPSIIQVIDQGQPLVITRNDPNLRPSDRDYLDAFGLATSVAIPIIFDNRVIGIVTLEDSRPERTISNDDLQLAQLLVNQVAAAVENARLHSKNRDYARERRRSDARYRNLFKTTNDLIQSVKPDGSFTYVNPAWRRVLGYTPAEVAQLTMFDVLHQDCKDHCGAILEQVIGGQTITKTDITFVTKDGRRIELVGNVVPLYRKGRVVATQAILRDVTVEKEAERQLKASNTLLRAIGQAQASFINGQESFPLFNAMLDQLLLVTDSEYGFIGEILHNADGQPYLKTRAITNIAWNETTAAMYRENVEQGMDFLNLNTLFGHVMTSRQFVIANSPGTDPRRGGLPPGHPPLNAFLGLPLKKDDELIGMVGIANRPSGYNQPMIDFLQPFLDTCGNIIQAYRDKTIRHQTARELQQERQLLARRVQERTTELHLTNQELARASRLKDEFLANMSHELRTPLNAILGMAEVLSEGIWGDMTDGQARSVGMIESSGRHLLELINDILDLSKIEAGELQLYLEPTDLAHLCEISLQFIKQRAHKKRINVSLNVDQYQPTVLADERRLKQILVNLLTNAVKFTQPNGEIGLEVTAVPAEKQVKLTVWDTGVGIPAAQMDRLFQPFLQIENDISRNQEGTGLGLSLVASLAAAHGGSVSVESQPQHGSRFTVRLPWDPNDSRPAEEQAAAPVVPLPEEPKIDGRQVTILLAEDNINNQKTIQHFLEHHQFKVVIANNGAEAVEMARSHLPAVILMDVQMPVLDGLEAIRRIRADHDIAHIPVIAITALAMPGDKERCLSAGANEYISKPVKLKPLITTISQLAEKNPND